MVNVMRYRTPQDFLDVTDSILEEKELENNLMLGICNGFEDKTKEYTDCVFINAVNEDGIQASSIKTIPKAIVSGITANVQYVEMLADYYFSNSIDLAGVVGERFYSETFSRFYGKQSGRIQTMLVHKLAEVKTVPIP